MKTLKDVAKKAGVTVTTVSRMLNDRGYVSEKTRNKIKDAMKELNYQPNEIARSLSLKRSNFIGLIIPSASNLFFCKVVDAIEHYTFQHGYKLLLCNSNLESKKENEYFELLSANKVAGVILASHTQNIDNRVLDNIPIISMDRIIGSGIPSICSDNFQGGVLAAEHLISRGCKKLAHISGSAYLEMDANKRFSGFKHVCEKNNVEYIVIDTNEEQFQTMQYESTVDNLLDNYPEIDGVFTSNDVIAAHVIRVCHERGIEVPNKLKVVGYDDTDVCVLCHPQITTIRQSIDDLCRYAVESVISKSENKAIPMNVTFPVSLIKRGST